MCVDRQINAKGQKIPIFLTFLTFKPFKWGNLD